MTLEKSCLKCGACNKIDPRTITVIILNNINNILSIIFDKSIHCDFILTLYSSLSRLSSVDVKFLFNFDISSIRCLWCSFFSSILWLFKSFGFNLLQGPFLTVAAPSTEIFKESNFSTSLSLLEQKFELNFRLTGIIGESLLIPLISFMYKNLLFEYILFLVLCLEKHLIFDSFLLVLKQFCWLEFLIFKVNSFHSSLLT